MKMRRQREDLASFVLHSCCTNNRGRGADSREPTGCSKICDHGRSRSKICHLHSSGFSALTMLALFSAAAGFNVGTPGVATSRTNVQMNVAEAAAKAKWLANSQFASKGAVVPTRRRRAQSACRTHPHAGALAHQNNTHKNNELSRTHERSSSSSSRHSFMPLLLAATILPTRRRRLPPRPPLPRRRPSPPRPPRRSHRRRAAPTGTRSCCRCHSPLRRCDMEEYV